MPYEPCRRTVDTRLAGCNTNNPEPWIQPYLGGWGIIWVRIYRKSNDVTSAHTINHKRLLRPIMTPYIYPQPAITSLRLRNTFSRFFDRYRCQTARTRQDNATEFHYWPVQGLLILNDIRHNLTTKTLASKGIYVSKDQVKSCTCADISIRSYRI